MSENPRDYNCKDEELPVVGGFVLDSFKKDLVDFTAFSPLFDEAYVSLFESKNTEVSELVTPAEETAQLKAITTGLNSKLFKLRKPMDQLANYIDFAGDLIPLSVADFGISPLRDSVTRGDVEGVIRNLGVVNRNIGRYSESLTAQGLKAEIIDFLAAAGEPIEADNNAQHQIVSNRLRLVEANVSLCNELYAIIRRVCKTGKAIYKEESPAKVADYTFSKLMKEVRRKAAAKTKEEAEASNPLTES